MSVAGVPTAWVGLIDSMVPQILALVIATWETMPRPSPDELEDVVTQKLCRALRQSRNSREIPFQIHTQYVELDPQPGQDTGRLDICFMPLIAREDVYFCLECKRLNVVSNGKTRAYASEYVTFGMLRLVTGQYSKTVRCGGMLAYVLDGNVARAMKNVEANIRTHYLALCMTAPGRFQLSSVLTGDARARETHHNRRHEASLFCIHHLFMAAT